MLGSAFVKAVTKEFNTQRPGLRDAGADIKMESWVNVDGWLWLALESKKSNQRIEKCG